MSRMVFAILSGLAEEAILVMVVLIALPGLGVTISLGWLTGLMALLAASNTIFFLAGRRMLNRKPIAGLAEMDGVQGEVVNKLAPGGLVRIRGELWRATSEDGEIEAGRTVTVVRREGLTLIVAEDLNPPKY